MGNWRIYKLKIKRFGNKIFNIKEKYINKWVFFLLVYINNLLLDGFLILY